MPEPMAIEIKEMSIEAQPALFAEGTCTLAEITAKLGELYGMITGVLGEDMEEATAGQPFAIYKQQDDGKIHIKAGIPVIDEYEDEGGVVFGAIEEGNVLMAIHMGPYEEVRGTYDAVKAYMEANNKEANGDPWEVYVTDPGEEPDQSKWITEVYYPVK